MILSIESSCDDSSIAITDINSYRVIFHKKISQEKEHNKYGGVVPELASRLHLVDLPYILEQTKPFLDKIKAVAVTNGPGLSVTLLQGISMAKTIAVIKNIPLIAVNHLYGHIYSLFIEKKDTFPFIILLISGGHTQIIKMKSLDKIIVIANSLDDSIGETFDKIAKMMGLGYPGGSIIENLAKNGDENRFNFPIPLKHSPLIAFSFSGIKNSVRLLIEKLGGKNSLSDVDRCDISASFQKSATEHLLQKTTKIFKNNSVPNFAIVGGVSANLYIRDNLTTLCRKFEKRIYFTDLEYCSDNAVMIGRYGIEMYKINNTISPYKINLLSENTFN